MRVISKARLRAFWEVPGYEDAEGPLKAWHTHVSHKSISWHSWGDLKSNFASASSVGNCVVFNIGGNKYRLIARVLYPCQKVFILRVMTHSEYDEDKWKEACGCFQPPPKLQRTKKITRNRNQKGR